MVQAKGIKMSTQISHDSTLSTLHSLKVIGIIVGMSALIIILVAIIAHLSEQADFSLIITYLSDIRVIPFWPQIGLFPTPVP
jgi:hypothetical protein